MTMLSDATAMAHLETIVEEEEEEEQVEEDMVSQGNGNATATSYNLDSNIGLTETTSEISSSSSNQQQRVIGVPNGSLNNSADLDLGCNDVVLSVIIEKQTGSSGIHVGAAYYMSNNGEMYTSNGWRDTSELATLCQLLLDIRPTEVIIGAKSMARAGDILTDLGVSTKVLPESLFNYNKSFTKINSIFDTMLADLPSERDMYIDNRKAHLVRQAGVIDRNNPIQCRPLGALYTHINNVRTGVELEDRDVVVPITAVTTFHCTDIVTMSLATFKGLQIFVQENHPSAVKKSKKESLSLFGIASRKCKSPGGKGLLRSWFMRPSRNIDLIRDRQAAIEYLTDPGHGELGELQRALSAISNVARTIVAMKKGIAKVYMWQSLARSCSGLREVFHVAQKARQVSRTFHDYCQAYDHTIVSIGEKISATCDFDSSSKEKRFVVNPLVDSTLDEMKRRYQELPEIMTQIARDEIALYPIELCAIVYMPQLGFLLQVPCNRSVYSDSSRLAVEEKLQIEGMEFMFLSEDAIHYKTPKTHELDEHLGDCLCDIVDRETEIMCGLQALVLENQDVLLELAKLSFEMDCLQTLSQLAITNGYTMPTVTTDRVLTIKGGRHAVLEEVVSPFVVNDTHFVADGTRTLVVTGANASGKSVYLRQVALLTYMAHIGSFVPAASATIGTIDQIFTRLISIDSTGTGLSSFATDLNSITDAIRHSTEQSLVVIDEFGKGTRTLDGVSLLLATIEEFLKREEQCPALLISTHFHIIAKMSLLPDTPLLEKKLMKSINNDQGQLVHLFQLDSGSASSSNATASALSAGMPKGLVDRASSVSTAIAHGEHIQPLVTERDLLQNKINTEIVTKFLRMNIDDATLDEIADLLAQFASRSKLLLKI